MVLFTFSLLLSFYFYSLINSKYNFKYILNFVEIYKKMSFQTRVANPQDFDIMLRWLGQQKWNSGTHDHFTMYKQIDPSGFFVGALDGQVIASLSVFKWSKDYAFLDLYIVDQKYRGHGYGLKLWQQAMKTVPNHNLALDAVVDQQKTYEKSGFKLHCRHVRHEAYGQQYLFMHQNIKQVKNVPLQEISQYDKRMFQVERENFLKAWFQMPQSQGFVYQESQKDEKQQITQTIKGYAAIRKSGEGFRVGPLFADSQQIAQQLLKCCLAQTPKNIKLFIDVPDNNKQALQLAKKLQMKVGLILLRMYTKGVPMNVNQSAVYGVTSTEFG